MLLYSAARKHRRNIGAAIGSLKHNLDHRMMGQGLIEPIKLFAGLGVDGYGKAEIITVAAWPHLEQGRIKVGRVGSHDLADGFGEAINAGPHYFDGKAAGITNQRFFRLSHR
jgi:hypothetical protein